MINRILEIEESPDKLFEFLKNWFDNPQWVARIDALPHELSHDTGELTESQIDLIISGIDNNVSSL